MTFWLIIGGLLAAFWTLVILVVVGACQAGAAEDRWREHELERLNRETGR